MGDLKQGEPMQRVPISIALIVEWAHSPNRASGYSHVRCFRGGDNLKARSSPGAPQDLLYSLASRTASSCAWRTKLLTSAGACLESSRNLRPIARSV